MKITAKQIKSLRDETKAGIMDVKEALEEAKGNEKKALVVLKKKGLEKVKKRAGKEVSVGQVFAYIHSGGQVGAIVILLSETDFVSRSDEFAKLGKELAMQIASMAPKNLKELLAQTYIRDPKKKIDDLIIEYSAKFKEKIAVRAFERFSVK